MTEWNDEPGSHEEHGHDELEAPRNTTGSMLFYFFAVVILCAISLGVGYMMGKRSAPPSVDAAQVSQPAPVSGAPKPGASRSEEAAPVETTTPETEAAPSPKPAAPKPATTKAAVKTPEMATNPAKGFMVQVAAVTRSEDADTLAGALRKKKYPVFVVPPAGADKFYRVQVGPFAELKDADAMKSKLAGDGYNAIVKK
ncbi:MAG TPA: SPOR domain-containing protein [Terriglobales bacterium]|jgi:cell division septation protein DedD|nr:SPOR domain-containing protein [Terriglobales bacterium]